MVRDLINNHSIVHPLYLQLIKGETEETPDGRGPCWSSTVYGGCGKTRRLDEHS